MSKEQLIADFKAKQDQAVGELVDAAIAEGVASVPASPDVQAQIDAAVAAAKADLQPQIDQLKAALADDEQKLADMTALEKSVEEKLQKIKDLLA